jgi:hypothetical protein
MDELLTVSKKGLTRLDVMQRLEQKRTRQKRELRSWGSVPGMSADCFNPTESRKGIDLQASRQTE